MADKYASEEAAVEKLRPGWKIVGRAPYEVEVINPAATVPGPDGKIDPLAPPKIKQTVGTILSIEGPNGEPDKMTVSTPSAADFSDPNRQSGPVISVLEGPAKGPKAGGTNQPSDPSKWQGVTRPGTTDVVGTWDPVNNEFHAIAAPPGAQPTGKYDPVTVTDPDGTQRQVGMVDSGDKSFHPLAAAPTNPSGKYENQYVTNADGSKRLVGMVDTGDKHFIPVSADPTTQKRTIQTPNAVYSVDDNDNVKKLFDVDKTVPLQAVVIDGEVFSFDPNEKDPNKRLTSIQSARPPAQIKQGDTTYIRKDNPDGTFTYELPPGVAKTPALQTNTTAKTLDWYDDQGNLIKSVENKNYVEPKVDAATPPATNLTAPKILIPDPDHPGQLKWIDNEARVTASQALQNIATQLSGHVVDGNISVDEAKAIIDGANTAMSTAAQGATSALSAMNQGAQSGANLLNQRVQAAQNFIQQGTGLLGQTKHGLLVAPGGDFGQNLVQGAAGFATELGGGPEVYQAAANLVRRADPTGAMGQDAAAAYSTLTQMFQKYRQATGGQPHPAEVAAAGGQQVNQGSFQSPGGYNPNDIQWNQPANAANVAGRTMGPGGVISGPQAPTFVAPQAAGIASAGAVAGQNYGAGTAYTGGVAPWNAQPGPSFVAPPPTPAVPQPSPVIAGGMQTVQPQARNITITVPTG
jgi:hypothetical protein